MTDLMVILLAVEALLLLSLIWNLSRRIKRLEESYHDAFMQGSVALEEEDVPTTFMELDQTSNEERFKAVQERLRNQEPEIDCIVENCPNRATRSGLCRSHAAKKRWGSL